MYNQMIEDAKLICREPIIKDWVDEDTIIINCDPSSSSILSQVCCNELSEKPLDIINLILPLDQHQVVWYNNEYINFTRYNQEFVSQLSDQVKYLFLIQKVNSDNDKYLKKVFELTTSKEMQTLYCVSLLESERFIGDYALNK